MKKPTSKGAVRTGLSVAVASAMALISLCAQAESDDVTLAGVSYFRGGAYFGPAGAPRGGYTLGGDLQKFRLGNEGDAGIDFGLRKWFDVDDKLKWSVMYMPSAWNGKYATAQAFVSMTGLDFAPEAHFWAGQRRLRIQDVHIVDYYVMDYGDNNGAGVTDYDLGFATLGVGVFTGGTFNNNNIAPNNASRIDVDLSQIHTNEDGTLRVLAMAVSGKFQMGLPGAGLSISHNQADFLVKGLTNTVFLQGATGHAGLNGQFQGLGDVVTGGVEQPGMQSRRIVETITWQTGAFGGQALAAYELSKIDGGIANGQRVRDSSMGGRISYATHKNFKWLFEAGSTGRMMDGQPAQHLNKFTIAPTLALAKDFWSRPELRFYVTRAKWNAAAANANSGVGGFAIAGRTATTLAGIQMEAWW